MHSDQNQGQGPRNAAFLRAIQSKRNQQSWWRKDTEKRGANLSSSRKQRLPRRARSTMQKRLIRKKNEKRPLGLTLMAFDGAF